MPILIFLGLAIALIGCQSHCPWHLSYMPSTFPENPLSRLNYPKNDTSKGIELSLVRIQDITYAYLNVHVFEVPPYQDNPHLAQVHIKAKDVSCSFIVDRLAGGQRLRLSAPCLSTLLSLLSRFGTVTITTGHYSQTYLSKGFEQCYQKLIHQPFNIHLNEWIEIQP